MIIFFSKHPITNQTIKQWLWEAICLWTIFEIRFLEPYMGATAIWGKRATLHIFFIWNPSPHSLACNNIRSCTRLLLKLEINFFLNCVLRVAQEHENNFFLIFWNKFHNHQSILSQSLKLTSKPKSYNTIQVYDLFKKFLQNP